MSEEEITKNPFMNAANAKLWVNPEKYRVYVRELIGQSKQSRLNLAEKTKGVASTSLAAAGSQVWYSLVFQPILIQYGYLQSTVHEVIEISDDSDTERVQVRTLNSKRRLPHKTDGRPFKRRITGPFPPIREFIEILSSDDDAAATGVTTASKDVKVEGSTLPAVMVKAEAKTEPSNSGLGVPEATTLPKDRDGRFIVTRKVKVAAV